MTYDRKDIYLYQASKTFYRMNYWCFLIIKLLVVCVDSLSAKGVFLSGTCASKLSSRSSKLQLESFNGDKLVNKLFGAQTRLKSFSAF